MEILKILYFLLLGIFIIQCIYAKQIKPNWALIVAAVAVHSLYFFSWEGIIFLITTGIISTTAELISLKTPINVFGVSYRYDLGNKFFPSRFVLGKVLPVEVSAAWVLLKYLSLFISLVILSPLSIDGLSKAVISSILLVSFDFILDPYAVSEGAWKWSKQGTLFNVPWQNFLGWFIVGFIISVLFTNLKTSKIDDVVMVIPVFVVSALFPISLGGRLISISNFKGALVLMPLTLFILIGLCLVLI